MSKTCSVFSGGSPLKVKQIFCHEISQGGYEKGCNVKGTVSRD